VDVVVCVEKVSTVADDEQAIACKLPSEACQTVILALTRPVTVQRIALIQKYFYRNVAACQVLTKLGKQPLQMVFIAFCFNNVSFG
jgi:hypothetical protein